MKTWTKLNNQHIWDYFLRWWRFIFRYWSSDVLKTNKLRGINWTYVTGLNELGFSLSPFILEYSLDIYLVILSKNTSLAAPGALAHRLQRRTAHKANEANLDPPNQKSEITSL